MAAADPPPFALRGHVIDAPRFGALRSFPRGAVVVHAGRIVFAGAEEEAAARWTGGAIEWRSDPEVQVPVVLPGLVDVHTHLPQYPVVARPEPDLLPWLERHIFPAERGFRGDRVGPIARAFFADAAGGGTTTLAVYGAIWEESCHLAFEAAEAAGLRVTMGKVMMDVGSYSDLAPLRRFDASIAETERLCARWHGAADGRLRYGVSPRFALSCSREIMKRAAEIARDHGAVVQTHLAESRDEVRAVRERFPEAIDYTDVYDRAGILGPSTVLGHCIHLGDREIRTLADRGAAVAHCPSANFFLNSGIMPLDRLRSAGLRIGLGSDVAAGPELNLWQVMREAVDGQKARRFSEPDLPGLTCGEAFFLATRGGAEALGLEDSVGMIAPGLEADLQLIDLARVIPAAGREDGGPEPMTAEQVIAALVYRGHPGAVRGAWVRGEWVHPAPDQCPAPGRTG